MKTFSYCCRLALLVVMSVSLVAVPVVAQSDNSTATEVPAESSDGCEAPERVDEYTAICSAELVDETAVLVLRSEKNQRVAFTDAGVFLEGGEIESRRYTLREDSLTTVRMSVTLVDGFAGVSIETNEVNYAKPIEKESTLIGGPWSTADVQLAGFTGVLSGVVLMSFVGWRRKEGVETEPNRVL